VSSECKKKRAEEEHLHVYVAKTLGPSGSRTTKRELVRSARLQSGKELKGQAVGEKDKQMF